MMRLGYRFQLNLLMAACACWSLVVAATTLADQPPQPDIVEVVVQGMGTDANSSMLNAYSNAVQQALGLYVDAETLVQNDEIVRDKILTYSKGFIQEVTKLKESQANGLFQVSIRAKIQRQKLLEQAKANNITVKAVEGLSLQAQVESQLKQEEDANALFEKAMLPIMGTTFHRAELVPSTQEYPNPVIDKTGTDSNVVTLGYKVYILIDEEGYFKHVKNVLLPVLDQISTIKKDSTIKYSNRYGHKIGIDENQGDITGGIDKNLSLLKVLTWKDQSLTSSRWRIYTIPSAVVSKRLKHEWVKSWVPDIDLSLMDESNELVAIGNVRSDCGGSGAYGCAIFSVDSRPYSYKSINTLGGLNIISFQNIFIAPYFSTGLDIVMTDVVIHGNMAIIPLRTLYYTINVTVPRKDLSRIKMAKLEVKPSGG